MKTTKLKTILNIALLLIVQTAFAQDVLFKKDNSKIEVKIVEVNKENIKYKLYTFQDGPDYIISKSEVALIIYKNGMHEVFKDEAKPIQGSSNIESFESLKEKKVNEKTKRFMEVTKTKNIVFLNALELMNSGIAVSYMKEVANNMLNIHVPLAVSFDQPYFTNTLGWRNNNYEVKNYKLTQKQYDLGLGVYVNTSGKRAVTHFVGPLIRYAKYNGQYEHVESSYSPTTGLSSYSSNKYNFEMNETSILLNNGFLYRLSPNFNMMINVAIGRYVSRTYTKNDPGTVSGGGGSSIYGSPLALQGGFCFGYRF